MHSPLARGLVELGVDFGTSHTVAVLRRPSDRDRPLLFDASPMLPSAVFAGEEGALATGRDALRAGLRAPDRLEPNPKRRIDEDTVLLGEREYGIEAMFAAVLARVREEALRVAGSLDRVRLTVPASWGPRRRARLAEAAVAAGLPAPLLAPEPVAAAAYFTEALGHMVPDGSAVAVADFGAGTFDVSVVARRGEGFEVLGVAGRDDIGGLDLDAALVDHLGRQFRAEPEWERLSRPGGEPDRRRRLELFDEVRLAKERLSRQASADILVPLLERSTHLTRGELERVVSPLLERAVALTGQTIDGTRRGRDRIAGLFLVGGASRMPLVATMLHRGLDIAPTVLEQPELVVAEGSLLVPWREPVPPTEADSPPSAVPMPTPPEPSTVPMPVPEADSPPPTVPMAPSERRRTSRRRLIVSAAAIAAAAGVAAAVLWWPEPTGEKGSADEGGTPAAEAVPADPLASALVAASADGHVRVLDIESGDLLGDYPGGAPQPALAMEVAADGDRSLAVAADGGGAVRLWDLRQGAEAGTMRVHDLAVGALDLTRGADGHLLAVTGSNDDTATVLDLTVMAEVATFAGHTDDVRAVRFARIGDRLVVVSAGKDGVVRVWDAASADPVGEFADHGPDTDLYMLAVGEIGGSTVIASGGDDATVRVWDLDSREPIGPPIAHEGTVREGVFIGDEGERALVTGGDALSILISDPRSGVEAGRVEGLDDPISSLAVDTRGEQPLLFAGDASGEIRIWDLETGEPLRTLPAAGESTFLEAIDFPEVPDAD